MSTSIAQRATHVNTGRYTYITCGGCGVEFAMAERLHQMRMVDGLNWYCPLGCVRHYPKGKTETEVLREVLELERRAAANADERYRSERASHIATKGQLTKARKRAEHAMCPVQGCKRSFANVARHIENQHPNYHAA